MKVTCQSCQAKYTIADEKVLGKAVKIRCKKCGATILLDGTDPSALSSSGSSSTREPPGPDGQPQPQPEGWTVNVAEGDQRTMTDDEVVSAYRSGTIDLETYCWKDGMDDWLPLREIELLRAACTAPAERVPAAAPEAGPNTVQDLSLAAGPRDRAEVGAAAPNGFGASAPATAKRAAGRAPAADLFAAVAQAGGEEDVLTSAPAKLPQPHEEAQTVTGARNENSVLFSLSALTTKPSDRPPMAVGEASGLIDIRQLSAQLAVEEKKSSRVDDIMNLSGGGAFSPTLTAPVFGPPSLDDYAPSPDAAGAGRSAGRNRGLILLALGAGALVIVGALGIAVLFMHGKGSETAEKDKPGVEPAPTDSTMAAAPPASDTPGAGAAVPSAPAEPAPSSSAQAGPSNDSKADTKAASNTPAPKPTPPKEANPAPWAKTPAAPAVAAPVVEAAFNIGEAKSRLASAAAAAASCKKPGGPIGTGRVVVLFAPSGVAQSATITGPPFEGTPTGACVAGRFRAVRVPAFSGSPFSVAKSFSIN